MNDNDIIKALKCCRGGKREYGCNKCPLYCCVPACTGHLTEAALDLINRQKVEIEKWKKNCDELFAEMSERQKAEVKIARQMGRAEAIKEFAEKLKSHKQRMCGNDNGGLYWDQAVLVDDIDRVMKEMTEGEDEN